MSIRKTIAALATSGLVAASGAAILTAPAQAAPNMSTYSVICADGSDIDVVSAGPPDAFSVCANHGYNGGAIKPKGRRVLTEQAQISPDIRANAIEQGNPVVASDAATAAAAVEAAAPPPPDHPRDPVAPSDGLPVLNCSNSKVNPPQVAMPTGQAGWSLKNPAGATVAINPASNVAWSAVAGAQWIGPGGPLAANGTWTYTNRVRINACPNGQAAKLTASWRADNTGTLRVKDAGGVVLSTGNQAGTPNYGFLPASLSNHTFVFPVGASGVYTIEFAVQNTSGPTGLAGAVTLTR